MTVKTLIAYKNDPIYVPAGELLAVERATVGPKGLICWCINEWVNKDAEFPVSSEFIINFCEKL